VGQQRLGRQAAGNDTVRYRSLHNRLAAAPTAVDRAPGDPNTQVQGHGIQTLGFLDVDLVHGSAAARAASVLRFDHHFIAFEMGRQVAEVAPCRSPPGAPVFFAILSVLPGGLDRRDLLLEVFQGQLELLGIEALGLAPELRSNQLPDHQSEPLTLGIGLLKGTLEVITLSFQSIERSSLPLNKSFHLDQSGLQLIWIGYVFGMTS
jgi:hypothetical protein